MPESNIVEQAISKQNFFDSEIIFPLDSSQAKELTKENYLEYFSRLENLLAKRKTKADILTLKFASKPAIDALKVYFSQNTELRFKELKLELTNEQDANDLPELVKLAATNGLVSLNLLSTNLPSEIVSKILKEVQDNSISMDIVLPKKDEYLQSQQLLDESISDSQRKKRIELFDSQTIETTKAKFQNLRKRTRKLLNTKNIDIDTEIQVEVAVEQTREADLAIEEQFEDKTTSDLLDRDGFIELARADKFNSQLSETAKKRIGSSWDYWLGNINLVGLKAKEFASVQILVA